MTELEKQLADALRGCRDELCDVLSSINAERIHHDGDEFHERLGLAEQALTQFDAQAVEQAERGNQSVGKAVYMPGTTGFTMCAFEAAKVPEGTPLYTHAPPTATMQTKELPPLPEHFVPIGLLGAPIHYTKAAYAYADQHAQTYMRYFLASQQRK